MKHDDVLITGIGLLSSLGEGCLPHRRALTGESTASVIDEQRFPPYCIHPLPDIDWSSQITKRGDLRQMETWQRLGTFAAGLALDDAGMKNDSNLCETMDMVVAAGGGERDVEVDEAIIAAAHSRTDREILLNEKLTTELRPTLFLAQLSNLLAGNISIVHKVTGSSRTFMGEEGSGISAVETAVARIRSGQSSHVLVGGAYQCEHPDMLLNYELGGFLHRAPWAPVWNRDRQSGGGIVSGSGAAFLVLESATHAQARSARAYATIDRIVSTRTRRSEPGKLEAIVLEMARSIMPDTEDELMVMSGASGALVPTLAEQDAFAQLPHTRLRGFSSLTGHLKEAQFPFSIALAAIGLHEGLAFPPINPEYEKTAGDHKPQAMLCTSLGFVRNAGMAMLSNRETSG